MDFNNRTILITGLIIASIVAMYMNYQDIALAIVSGLVGYLSKDVVSVESNDVPIDQPVVSVVSNDVPVESSDVPVDMSVDDSSNDVEENVEDIA